MSITATMTDDIDAHALKLNHKNKVSHFLTAMAVRTSNDDTKCLAQAFSMRYTQSSYDELRGLAPGQKYCDNCAGVLVAGVTAVFRITTRAPQPQLILSNKMTINNDTQCNSNDKSNNDNNNDNNNSSNTNKKRRKLTKNAIKNLEIRQEKLRVRLAAQGVEYIAGHGRENKTDTLRKKSVDALGRKRRWLLCACQMCHHQNYTLVEDISKSGISSFTASKAESRSSTASVGESDKVVEPSKKKRKKNSLVAKLAAQKQARSASSGFSLGLSDFLAKK